MSIDFSINDSIAFLKLNTPQKLNALSSLVMREIDKKLIDVDQKAKVLVITGCDRAFAAGVDIKEIESHSSESANLLNFIDCSWESVSRVKIPTIAAVSGYALGGGFELALMCDIIIAAENAKFGFPEVNLGLMPGMGGHQFLTRIVGPKIAAELIMSGDPISAVRAQELNIVSRVVENSKLISCAMDIARKIAEKPIASLKVIKESIGLAQNSPLIQGIKSERQMFRALFSTKDKEERISRFLKRDKTQ